MNSPLCNGLAMLLTLAVVHPHAASFAMQTRKPAPKTSRERVIDFCRNEALTRLNYSSTVEWLDTAKEDKGGTWLIAGIRTVKGPSGSIDQQFTCRVQLVNDKPQLRMIQLFKESTKSGRDIFELR